MPHRGLTLTIRVRCRNIRLFAAHCLVFVALLMTAELIGSPALADDSMDGTKPERSTYDDGDASTSEGANRSMTSSTTQSSGLSVPPEVDIAPATAVRLPIHLSRSVDELPLGTCLRVSGLPAGVTLSGGQANPGNGWIVPLWALEDLKIRLSPDGVSGDVDLVVALVDNHNAVIDQQTTRLRISPAAHPTPALADRDAASSVTAAPPLTDQKQVVAEPRSSPTTNSEGSTNEESHKFELTNADFHTEGRGGVNLVKQTGLPENHRHTTGIAVADRYSTDFAMVDELTRALKAPATANNRDMQIYPTPGSGGLKPVRDVLTLPSTDFAIVSVPVMNKLRSTKAYGDIGERLALIGPLLTEELHVLATQHVDDVHDLGGKTVSLGPKGSLAATLGHDILAALDVKANEVALDLDDALDGMRDDKIAAIFLISGKPVRRLAERVPRNGLHFLTVPYLRAFERDFVRTSLTHDDYPGFVAAGADVETIGVRSALWAYRWPEQSERFRLVKLFLDRLTKHLPDLRSGAFHPKWKQADLNGSVSGWSRFYVTSGSPAESGKPSP